MGDTLAFDPTALTRSLVGYGTVTIGPGLLAFFMGVYNNHATPYFRASVWLAYKMICFLLTRVWCKLSCYAMQDDVHSLLLIFMMVAAF